MNIVVLAYKVQTGVGYARGLHHFYAGKVVNISGMSQVIYNDGYNSAILSLIDDGDITIELADEKLKKSSEEIRKMLEDFVAEKEKQPCK